MKSVWMIILIIAAIQSADGLTRDMIQTMSEKSTFCDLRHRSPEIECEAYIGETECADETLCWEFNTSSQNLVYFRCENGFWIQLSGTMSDVHNRHKRFLAVVGGIIGGVILVGTVVCLIFCKKPRPPRNQQPTVDCPSSLVLKIEEKLTTRLTVTYEVPKFTDKEDGQLTAVYEAGPKNGDVIDIGERLAVTKDVKYWAEDRGKLKVSCAFSVTVEAYRCPNPGYPFNGNRRCIPDKYFIYGGKCEYSCNKGYRLNADEQAVVECQKSGSWSKSTPYCEIIMCPTPTPPNNGTLQCSNQDTYSYSTSCTAVCDQGFGQEEGTLTTCNDNGQWSHDISESCKDIEPPHIDCSGKPQNFFANRSSNRTVVLWKEPTALDNVDQSGDIVIKRLDTDGPQQGDMLEVGQHFVKYVAVDSKGNESPECVIRIQVEADVIGDQYMQFNCSDSRFTYGVQCDLFCLLNFPLNGTSSITCERDQPSPEGYWYFPEGIKPECNVVTCPELDPPLNGALTYESQNLRPMAVMMCQGMYDIPYMYAGFLGILFCVDPGEWKPYSKVPDCSEQRTSERFVLPGNLRYTGNCSDEATQEKIKEIFLETIRGVQGSLDNECPTSFTCTVDDVTVKCGLSSRRKRYSHFSENSEEDIIINFGLSLGVSWDGISDVFEAIETVFDPAINRMKNVVTEMVTDGRLNIANLTLNTNGFQSDSYADFACAPGQIKDFNNCKSCPRGYVLDEETKECSPCPKGSYMEHDSGLVCTPCPEYYSTKESGSKLASDCVEMCGPGTVSYDEVQPCKPCPQGQYQGLWGQEKCLMCPTGATTERSACTSLQDCKDFDVFLHAQDDEMKVTEFKNDLENITINFWIRSFEETAAGLVLDLSYPGKQESVLTLSILEMLSLKFNGTDYETTFQLSLSEWTMMTLVWEGASGNISIYKSGELILLERVDAVQGPVLSSGSSLKFFIYEDTYLSGLSLSAEAISETDTSSLMKRCSSEVPNSVNNMDVFMTPGLTEVEKIIPSNCDPINECRENPCGEHKCVNGIGDYICVCSNNFSGKNCTVPPDHCINHDCENGGTCVNHPTMYTCTCPLGHRGDHCQILPVDGGWGSWTPWTNCDVSCGVGSRSRSRLCDSPTKEEYGKDCVGQRAQTDNCNMGECRVCPDIGKRAHGITKKCNGSLDFEIECDFKCRDGHVLSNGMVFNKYKCGQSTNYEWEPNYNPASCSKIERPKALSSTTTSIVEPTIACENVTDVENAYRQSISTTACIQAGTCEASVSVSTNCGRQRRSTDGSSVIITYSSIFKETGELDIEGFYENNTVSPALLEWLSVFVDMETTAQQMSNDSEILLAVDVGGVSYQGNSSSISAQIVCVEGYAVSDDVCAACPVGTRFENSYCVPCEVGFYQDGTAKTTCQKCPAGYTTASTGSMSMTDCFVIPTTSATSTTTKELVVDDEKENVPDTSSKQSVLLPVVVSTCAAVVITGIVIGFVVTHRFHKKGALKQMVPTRHAKVHPDTGSRSRDHACPTKPTFRLEM